VNKTPVPPLHDVDIKHLKVFKAVVECGGLSAAEEITGLGISALSKQLSELETRLGTPLCKRGRGGFVLTPEGEATYRATLRLLDSIDEFRESVAAAKGTVNGQLSVWLVDHLIWPVADPVVAAFRAFCADYPAVSLSINVAGPNAVERALAERKAIVGLTISKSDLPELEYQVVGVEHASMYCARGHPAYGKNEANLRALLADSPPCIRRGYLVHDALPEMLRSTSAPIAYHVEATVLLLLTGAYVGMVPDQIARAWVDSRELYRLPLEEFHTERPLFLVRRKGQSSERAAALLSRAIVNAFQQSRERVV
jgi:LysR family transcriptional regulator, transcriptional activator for bauABCD operon